MILADGTLLYADPHTPTTTKMVFSADNGGICSNGGLMISDAVSMVQGPNIKQMFTAPFFVKQSVASAPMLSNGVLALLTFGMVVIALVALRHR